MMVPRHDLAGKRHRQGILARDGRIGGAGLRGQLSGAVFTAEKSASCRSAPPPANDQDSAIRRAPRGPSAGACTICSTPADSTAARKLSRVTMKPFAGSVHPVEPGLVKRARWQVAVDHVRRVTG